MSPAADPVVAWLFSAAPLAGRLGSGAALAPSLAALLRTCAALPPRSAARGGSWSGAVSTASPLSGLAQHDPAQTLAERARAEAARFSTLVEGLPHDLLADLPDEPLDNLRAAAASLLRLLALAACAPSLLGPAAPEPAGPATPGARERLVVALCDAALAGQEPSSLHAALCSRLAARNPLAAAHPQFGLFTASLAGLPRGALALREVVRAARARRPAPPGALEGLRAAATTLSPAAFAGLHQRAPAAWFDALCPARAEPGFWGSLASECDAALEAAGHVWEAQQSPPWQLAALGALVFSRLCTALALCEEHPFP